MPLNNPANIYLFKVNYRNTRKRCEIFSMLTITTPERPGVFISKLKIGHRKQEQHRKFRLEVAVAVIRMLKWRYYATFKVRKIESLFSKINRFAKNCHLHWIAGRANILNKYIIYIFFNFGRGFRGSFSMLFPKASASCCKKISTNFCCITRLYLRALHVYIYKCVSDF